MEVIAFTDGAAVGWGGESAPVNDDAMTGGGGGGGGGEIEQDLELDCLCHLMMKELFLLLHSTLFSWQH